MVTPVLYHRLCVGVYVIATDFTIFTRTYPKHAEAYWFYIKIERLNSNSSYVGG